MVSIYSKTEPENLLAIIQEFQDINKERINLTPAGECIQAACKKLKNNVSFKAHRHNPLKRETTMTQEAWVIIAGSIKAVFYDLDDSIICEKILKAGDCAVVFRAGHSFEVLEDNTLLYEFKNGPYYGVELDKKFINEN